MGVEGDELYSHSAEQYHCERGGGQGTNGAAFMVIGMRLDLFINGLGLSFFV